MKNQISYILIIALSPLLFSADHLPLIKLKDLQNKKHQLNDYYKKGPILINFWNLACEPCKKEMKELNKLHIKYGENGFQVVSINIDNTRSMSKVKSFVKSQKYVFTVLSDPRAVLFRKMGGKVMPYVIIADSTGEVINRHVGYNPGDEKKLEKEIINLLQSNVEDSTKVKEKKIEPLLDIPPTASDSTIKSLD